VLASYRDFIQTGPAATGRSRREISGPSKVDASELRARASRYRHLADGLYDPRVIAEVQACARDLEAEAAWIEKRDSFGARVVIQRYRIGG
jgi:hypothetical protein